jgi:hypothetical protein
MSDHARALRQLVDSIKQSWARGLAPPDARAALAQHQQLLDDRAAVLDLAYEEYRLRKELGEQVDTDSFCAGFGSCGSELRRVLLLDQLLESSPEFLSAPAPAPESWPGPGAVLGDLTLVRELGRGAFARVYLAREASTGDRPVALKISRQGGGEARTLGRLSHDHIVPVLWADRAEGGLHLVCMPFLGSATLQDLLDEAYPDPGGPPPPRASRRRAPPRADRTSDLGASTTLGASTPPVGGQVIDRALKARTLPNDPEVEPRRDDRPFGAGSYVDGVVRLAAPLADALAFLHGKGVSHRDLKPSNVLLSPSGRPLLLDFNLSAGTG